MVEFIEGPRLETHETWPNDPSAFGRQVAKFHQLPAAWYEAYKDRPKNQLKDRFGAIDTNLEAAEVRARFGDYASMIVLSCDMVTDWWRNMAATVKGLSVLLHSLLEPGSLGGRSVVGHGDLHGWNMMYRDPSADGDLVFIDLDICGRYPAVVDMVNMRPLHGASKQAAEECARGYIAGHGEGVGQFSRTSVDEVMIDMHIGRELRLAWQYAFIIRYHNSVI